MTEDEMVGWHHQLNGCEFEHNVRGGAGNEGKFLGGGAQEESLKTNRS